MVGYSELNRTEPLSPALVRMRYRAYGAARLDASFCCFCERALALSELRLLRGSA